MVGGSSVGYIYSLWEKQEENINIPQIKRNSASNLAIILYLNENIMSQIPNNWRQLHTDKLLATIASASELLHFN